MRVSTHGIDERSRPCAWHGDSWADLRRSLDAGRLAHALLFSGTPGTGRERFAMAAARLLLCEAPLVDGNCGRCKPCTLSRQGAHADFLELRPEQVGKRIGIDAVRELLMFTAKTSALGARKVIVVSPLEAFTNNAFNAMLKGLEEPADETFLLLVAARGQFLPATIRSRCQLWPLHSPAPEEASEWLRDALGDKADADPERLLRCLPGQPLGAVQRVADGSSDALLALHSALVAPPAAQSLTSLQAPASAVGEEELLSLLERQLRSAAVSAARRGERPLLQRALHACDRVRGLRTVLRSGCNPNVDLLRNAALRAWVAVWHPPGDATLRASSDSR